MKGGVDSIGDSYYYRFPVFFIDQRTGNRSWVYMKREKIMDTNGKFLSNIVEIIYFRINFPPEIITDINNFTALHQSTEWLLVSGENFLVHFTKCSKNPTSKINKDEYDAAKNIATQKGDPITKEEFNSAWYANGDSAVAESEGGNGAVPDSEYEDAYFREFKYGENPFKHSIYSVLKKTYKYFRRGWICKEVICKMIGNKTVKCDKYQCGKDSDNLMDRRSVSAMKNYIGPTLKSITANEFNGEWRSALSTQSI